MFDSKVPAADEADRLYVNRGLTGNGADGLVDERGRYFDDDDPGTLAHAANGTYDADFADFDNDGALDILSIRGPSPCTNGNHESLLFCPGMPWLRLSMSDATLNTTADLDFLFHDQSGRFQGHGLPDADDDPINFPDRIFHMDNFDLFRADVYWQYDFDDIDIADFDGDGDLDVALAARTRDRGNIVLINDGFAQQGLLGYFKAHVIDATPSGLPGAFKHDIGHDVRLVDIDQDGDSDIVFCNMTDDHEEAPNNVPGLRVYVNRAIDGNNIDRNLVDLDEETASRLLNASDAPANITSCRRLEVFDWDADGFPDVLAGTTASQTVQLYTNRGSSQPGVFTRTDLDAGASIYGSAHGDFDVDGDLDLFLGTWSRGNCTQCWPHFFENDGGSFVNATDEFGFWGTGTGDAGSLGAIAGALGDLDGDGDLDLYMAMGEFNRGQQVYGFDIPDEDRREPDHIFFNLLQCDPALDE